MCEWLDWDRKEIWDYGGFGGRADLERLGRLEHQLDVVYLYIWPQNYGIVCNLFFHFTAVETKRGRRHFTDDPKYNFAW